MAGSAVLSMGDSIRDSAGFNPMGFKPGPLMVSWSKRFRVTISASRSHAHGCVTSIAKNKFRNIRRACFPDFMADITVCFFMGFMVKPNMIRNFFLAMAAHSLFR